jgi:hypothetical protein
MIVSGVPKQIVTSVTHSHSNWLENLVGEPLRRSAKGGESLDKSEEWRILCERTRPGLTDFVTLESLMIGWRYEGFAWLRVN